MLRRLLPWIVLTVVGAALLAPSVVAGQGRDGGLAVSIELDGTIDPATERWISNALDAAAEDRAELAIIRLNTPGGLETSMRSMIQDILEAPMPVVVYTFPDGARAASAGMFITQAADVAAMVPQSNIGSATPVTIGPGEIEETLQRKIENDAAAFVRALAEEHGRNPDLAEEMVREAANVTARTAEEENLIDVVAASEEELLAELDGFEVQGQKEQTLETEGLRIERRDMSLQYQLLQILVNPNVAFLLLLGGLAGIAIEIFNPGMIFPGAFGAVLLLIGAYANALLPVTAAGILLLMLGLGLIITETQAPTGGALGAAGIAAFIGAGLLLYDTDNEAFTVNAPVVITVGVVLGGFTLFLAQKGLAARHGPVHTGWEEIVGVEGTVRVALDPDGQVFADGALWKARPAGEGRTLPVGTRVRVEKIDGLTLVVAPVEAEDEKS